VGVRKLSNIGGWTSKTSYTSMLAGNPVFVPYTGYESIATVSYPSGTGGDVVFSSIPSNFRTLQLRMFTRDTRVDNNSTYFITFNEDTTSSYSYQGSEHTGGGSIGGVNEINQTRLQGPTSAANTGASRFGATVMNIFDANQTNKFKTASYQAGFSNNNNGGARLWTVSATWRNTAAISTIRIAPNTGFAQYSHIALYGIA
jgi:hypothetical protein